MSIIIQIGLIGLLVFTPLAFGSVEVWSRSVLEWTAFGLAGLGLIEVGFRRDPLGIRPWLGPIALWVLVGLFMTLVLIQWIIPTSRYPYGTRRALLLGMAYLSIFGLVIAYFREPREIQRLTMALILIGFGVALLGILQKYAWNGKVLWIREVRDSGAAFGPFINRNHFAGYMEMMIPLAVGYSVAAISNNPGKGPTAWKRMIDRLTSESANQFALLFFMVVVMSVSLVLTLSRAGIVSFLTALILVGMILWIDRARKRWALLPAVIVSFLLVSLTWFGIGPIVDRLQTLFHLPEDASLQGRVEVWRDTAALVSDFPVTGAGLGAFGAAFPAYKTGPEQIVFDHAHNDYVQLLAETGWVGFGLAIAGILISAGMIISGLIRRRNPRARGLLMGAATGLLAMLVHGINDFNFHIPSNALMFSVILGLALNLSRPEVLQGEGRSRWRGLRPAGAGVGLILIVILIHQTAAAFTADRWHQRGLAAETDGRYTEARERYRRAVGWEPGHPAYHFAVGRIEERLYAQGDRSRLAEAGAAMERAASLAPTVAEYRLHLGWIEARRGNAAAATAQFERVLSLDPTNHRWRHYVGLWFAGSGQTERALQLARRLRDGGQGGMASEIEEKLKKT